MYFKIGSNADTLIGVRLIRGKTLAVNPGTISVANACPDFYAITWQQPQLPPAYYEIQVKSASDLNWNNALSFNQPVEYLELIIPDDCIDMRIRTACGDDLLCPWFSQWSHYSFCVDCCNVSPSIELETTGCELRATNTGTGDYELIEWDLGDDTILLGESIIYKYGSIGTYEVCVTYYCTNGTIDEYCEEVQIGFCCVERDVSFDKLNGTCDIAFTPIITGGVVNSYLWDFGDGVTSEEEFPVHVYHTSGVFEVCLKIIFDDFCTELFCQTLEAESCCEDNEIDFTNQGNSCSILFEPTIIGDNPISYHWTFGDGNSSVLLEPDHEYVVPGNYTVCFEVVYESGCVEEICKQIEVEFCFDDHHLEFLNFIGSCSSQFIIISINEPPISYE